MKPIYAHSFNLTPKEAVELQLKLKKNLIFDSDFNIEDVKLVAGADVSYSKKENMLYGVVVILTFPDLEVAEKAWVKGEAEFPYIPGLLAFREGPVLLEAFKKIEREPDIIFFDGHGISHPRGLGIASHLGVLLNKSSIGVAKKNLVGEVFELAKTKGATASILKDGKEIGKVLRTREKVKPIYVSVGHKIGLEKAVDLTLKTIGKYRILEPIRQAHIFSNEVRTSKS